MLWDSFDEIQSELELLQDSSDEISQAERMAF